MRDDSPVTLRARLLALLGAAGVVAGIVVREGLRHLREALAYEPLDFQDSQHDQRPPAVALTGPSQRRSAGVLPS